MMRNLKDKINELETNSKNKNRPTTNIYRYTKEYKKCCQNIINLEEEHIGDFSATGTELGLHTAERLVT
jgi:hypothetical protein